MSKGLELGITADFATLSHLAPKDLITKTVANIFMSKGKPYDVLHDRSRKGLPTFKPGFEVMNLKTHHSHGVFATLEEARGCVAYDWLTSWQIWKNDSVLVAEKDLS